MQSAKFLHLFWIIQKRLYDSEDRRSSCNRGLDYFADAKLPERPGANCTCGRTNRDCYFYCTITTFDVHVAVSIILLVKESISVMIIQDLELFRAIGMWRLSCFTHGGHRFQIINHNN